MKKQKKRILRILLCFAILCCLPMTGFLSMQVAAEQAGDYEYSVTGSKATITKYKGTESILNIPEVIDGYTVTEIGNSAFYECKFLQGVLIPDTVTTIGNYAFKGCSNLEKSNLPKSLKSIGYDAFCDCDSLTYIEIPKSLETVSGYSPFNDCDKLKTAVLEEGTTKVVGRLFEKCTGLEEVVFPDSLTEIENSAFWGCTSLQGVLIPDTVTTIGNYAFKGCSNLEKSNLPKSLKSIGYDAFCDCDSLTYIEIPKSLETVSGYSPFNDCDKLKTAVFEEGTTKVVGRLFEKCTGLEEVVFPDSLTEIENSAFWGCTSLQGVLIPDTVTTIGDYAFKGCSNLEKSNLPKSLKSIGYDAFCDCDSLTYIEIPKSLETVSGYSPFNDCDKLKTAVFEEGTTKVVGRLFEKCTGLEEVVFPDSLTEIENSAFWGCTSLQGVLIPDTVTTIGSYAFEGCSNLEKVKLSKVLESIGYRTFSGCTSLTKVTIPSMTTRIENGAFSNSEKLTVYGYAGSYAEEWADSAGAKFVDLSTIDPAEHLEERLDEAVDSALKAAAELDTIKTTATADEKKQEVDGVLGQMQKICQAQELAELGALSADTAISYVTQLSAVEERIKKLLGTTVSVVHKDSAQTFVLPKVENALLNVPAGENAVIKVAEVASPVFGEVKDQTVTALTLELYNSAGQKIALSVPVVVTLPIPSTLDVQKEIVIYHFREDGLSYAEKIPVVLDKNAGTISFVVGSFSTFVIANAPDGVAVSGTVTSFGDETAQTTVRILDGNESEVARTTVTGKSANYTIEGILPGTYTLEVSKANHVTRQYSITVESEAVVQDAGIWLIGDVNGDGNINSKDKKVLFNHIAGNSVLTDYAFLVGDITSDGNINSKDKKAMFNHIAGTGRLW